MRKLLGLGIFVTLAAVYFISPYWAVAGLSRAAIEQRPDTFSEFVDFDAIKSAVKRNIRVAPAMQSDRANGLAELVVVGAIEKMVSPEGLSRAFARGLEPYAGDSRLRMTWGLLTDGNLRWINPGRVSLGPAGSMRRTLFTWKLDRLAQ